MLVTGYGSVAERTEEGGCEPPDIERTNAAIRDAVRDLDFVDYVDVLGAFGGSAAAYSSWEFYEDAIHLNERGYERLFTLPAVQDFFECDAARTAAPTPMPVEDLKTRPPTPALETTMPPTPAEKETPSPTPGTETPGKETSPSPTPSPTPESDAAPRASVAAVVAAAAACFGAF